MSFTKEQEEEFGRRHCDQYIIRHDAPSALKNFLKVQRADPRSREGVMKRLGITEGPWLFATMKEDIKHNGAVYKKGQRVQITMASRFGDLGVSPIAEKKYSGYNLRLFADQFEKLFGGTVINVEEVKKILMDCLFKKEELNSESLPTEPWIASSGVVSQFGFNANRIEKHAGRIHEILKELPSEFQPLSGGGGGGWTFLNACQDKEGVLWGQQRDVDVLLTLGIAAGWAEIQTPRELWSSFPGGVPYFEVLGERKKWRLPSRNHTRRSFDYLSAIWKKVQRLHEETLANLSSEVFKLEALLPEGSEIRRALFRIRCDVTTVRAMNRRDKDKPQGWEYESGEEEKDQPRPTDLRAVRKLLKRLRVDHSEWFEKEYVLDAAKRAGAVQAILIRDSVELFFNAAGRFVGSCTVSAGSWVARVKKKKERKQRANTDVPAVREQ